MSYLTDEEIERRRAEIRDLERRYKRRQWTGTVVAVVFIPLGYLAVLAWIFWISKGG